MMKSIILASLILLGVIIPAIQVAHGQEYDYIVVGGGTTGCVMAARLSDDPNVQVLLLERGEDNSNINSYVVDAFGAPIVAPLAYADYFVGKNVFAQHHFSTETTLEGTSQYTPSAITLGGTSAINGNIFSRATIDDLARFNNPLWTFSGLLPDMLALEDCQGPICNPQYHGVGGPIVTNTFLPDPVEAAFFTAMGQAFNVSVDPDFNDGTAQGVGYLPRNVAVVNGVPIRQDAYTKFLVPVLNRSNLLVLTGAQVSFLSLDLLGHQHTAVYQKGHETYRAKARREVILSAGAYNDPKLLLLSGIGDCNQLQALGIQCQVNNSQVGQNFQECSATAMIFAVAQPVGPAAQPGNVPCVYSASPYYTGTGTDQETAMTSISPNGALYLVDVTHLRGGFVGQLELITSNPHKDPVHSFNLYPTVESFLPIVDQIQKFRQAMVLASTALNNPIIEVVPGPAVGNDDASLIAYLAEVVTAEFHHVGTCSMNKVVDGRLRLLDNQGNVIPGIRIASNSVIPAIMGTHSYCSTAMLIGQVGSRLIKEDWK